MDSKKEVSYVSPTKVETGSRDREIGVISPSLLAQPLALKNKSSRWHEQLKCWCVNFIGRVTVASVKTSSLCRTQTLSLL
ncbi:unnamed protein product [Cochlearia groenlandica]